LRGELVVGGGLGFGRGDFERGANRAVPVAGPKRFTVFVLGDGDGLEHGLGEIGEGGGDFRLDLALGDGAEEAGHGDAEIASGQQLCRKKARDVFSDLLRGEGFGFFLGMEVTEVQVAGAAGGAALAAIGRGESAQVGGTVFLGFGHSTANGAVRGHGILLKS
jgi:hypothetical protein